MVDLSAGGLDEATARIALVARIVDKLPEMVAYWDGQLRCQFANRAYELWFGVSPKWLVGRHMRELLGPLYAQNLPYIEGVLRGEMQHFEREIPDPFGGPPRQSLAGYVPDLVDGVVVGFAVLVTDVTQLKVVERALSESEARFRLAFDGAPIGMTLTALDGRSLRTNEALCRILGYSEEELARTPFRSITHPDDREVDDEVRGRLDRGEIQQAQREKRYLRKDGSVADVLVNATIVRDSRGEPLYYLAQVQDISERKRARDALRLSEAKFSGIVALSAEAIISVGRDHRITIFNESAERLFGYTQAEALGAPLGMLLPERFRDRHRGLVDGFTSGSTPSRQMAERGVELTGRRKSGEEFPLEAAISKLTVGGVMLLTVALRDITERRRRERSQKLLVDAGAVLPSSLDYEQTLASVARLGVRHLADLCIVDVDDEAAHTRQMSVAHAAPSKQALCDALTGLPFERRDFRVAQEVFETKQAVLVNAPGAGPTSGGLHVPGRLRDVCEFGLCAAIGVPLMVRDRMLGAILFCSSDPSRAYGEEDLVVAKELALRAALAIENSQLYRAALRATRTRDDVLAVVAHDVRNPLNSIGLAAQIIRHDLRDGNAERANRGVDTILRYVQRANRLIQDLLDGSRMDAQKFTLDCTCVPSGRSAVDAVEAQRLLASSRSIDLRADVPDDLPDLWADPHRLLQVLENLIGNALKFTPGGGLVTVGVVAQRDHVLFSVSDTGGGIAAEDLPHVFERYWQARDGAHQGAGLGLPICKGIVDALGGRIWAESTPGRGATFFFTLKKYSSAAASAATRPS